MNTCLRWHGGKSYLAKNIVELMPPHTRYCEPFFGGGAVLFSRDGEGVAEFVNDLNAELTNFWRVLGNAQRFEAFRRAAETVPFSQVEFHSAEAPIVVEGQDIRSVLNRAVAFFIRNRQSRQGLGKGFATPSKRLRRGMNENVSAWLSAVDGLPEFHKRLRRVEIRNQDAIEFIRELDSPETFFYCDPPYLHETRTVKDAYQHEMTAEQHDALLTTLGRISGKFLLSGYPSKLYDLAEHKYGWNHRDFHIDNKSSSSRTKEVKTERVWANYELKGTEQ